MRLITHNMLKCNVKGVENGYPLEIQAEEVEEVEADNPFELAFMKGLLRKINLPALKSAAANLGIDIIDELKVSDDKIDVDVLLSNDAALQHIHHLLFEINIETGTLVCPQPGRQFGVSDGIPNMLLHEDEV